MSKVVSKTKRVVKDQSVYENSSGVLTIEDVQKKLASKAKRMVYEEVSKFKNGNYASIFDLDSMVALSEDIILEIANRIQIYQKDPTDQKAVNPRGMTQYFATSFINHCQKIYEKHAKTDSRAGVMTVSSDEALSVAASKNLVYPENKYMLLKEFEHVLTELRKKDLQSNLETSEKFKKINKTMELSDYSYNAIIIEKTLEGYTPGDIKTLLGLSEIAYAIHRKNALLTAKDCFAAEYSDLKEHFDASIDPRFYYCDVKKRQKKEKRLSSQFNLRTNYYIENVYNKDKNTVTNKLYVKIDYMIGEDKSKDFLSEVFELKTIESSLEDSANINSRLWEESKYSADVAQKLSSIINSIKEKGKGKINIA